MAANYFLKFTPVIKGESIQENYTDQIEILSFSWGVTQAGGYSYGTGGTAAKANVQDLSLSFRMCPASPELMQDCATGKHLDSAVLTCLEAGTTPQKYLEITLTDVIVSSYQTGGSGDDKPIESMSLNFAKIKKEYFKQNDKGIAESAGTGTWDQQKSTTT
ncbi:MAG: type VI secretion system tube protein Hcp [Isosphaeraceae bacterium]